MLGLPESVVFGGRGVARPSGQFQNFSGRSNHTQSAISLTWAWPPARIHQYGYGAQSLDWQDHCTLSRRREARRGREHGTQKAVRATVRAFELLLTSKRITGRQAYQIGLVDTLVSVEELLPTAVTEVHALDDI